MRLHPLARQRARVLDPLPADAAEARVLRRVVLLRGPRVDDAARAEAIVEAGKLVRRRPVRQLGLLLRVEVVEVAEELVEAVDGRQVLVQVAEVVLAELAGGIAVGLEQLGDRHVLGLQADVRTRHPDLAQAGAEHALARDERGAPGGAALLAVGVGEAHPLVGDPVDVRRPVAHQPVAVTAQVRDPDVVAPDHQDVGLVRQWLRSSRARKSAHPRCPAGDRASSPTGEPAAPLGADEGDARAVARAAAEERRRQRRVERGADAAEAVAR